MEGRMEGWKLRIEARRITIQTPGPVGTVHLATQMMKRSKPAQDT